MDAKDRPKCQVGAGTVSLRYRARVLEVSDSYRSHSVKYEPDSHNQFTAIDIPIGWQKWLRAIT